MSADTFLPLWIAAALVCGALAIVAALLWLARAYIVLQRDYRLLDEKLRHSQNDVASLCAAALAIDQRLEMTDGQLRQLWSKLSETSERAAPQPPPQVDHPYGSVIQKVRSGASIAELMQGSGLSHDEAALLIRLHGAKSAS